MASDDSMDISEKSSQLVQLFPLDTESSSESADDEPMRLFPLDTIIYKSNNIFPIEFSESDSTENENSTDYSKKRIVNSVSYTNIQDKYSEECAQEKAISKKYSQQKEKVPSSFAPHKFLKMSLDYSKTEKSVQTSTDTVAVLSSVNTEIRQKIENLEANICSTFFSVYKVKDDRTMFMFTGLNRRTFHSLYKFVSDEINHVPNFDPLEQFFMASVFFKTGVSFKRLSKMCNFPVENFSRVMKYNVAKLYTKLKTVNLWSSKEEILNVLPIDYEYLLPRCRIVLGFVKVPMIQDPQPQNKKTFKGFVSVSPFCGLSFISNLHQENISNTDMVLQSGILDKLESGDMILADQKLDIEEELLSNQCTLTTLTSAELKQQKLPFSLQPLLLMQVEQAIQKIKLFKCCSRLGSKDKDFLSKVFYISAFFVNYQTFLEEDKSTDSHN